MSRKRQSGFTLIELMIVVVILGIIAAIAVPSYSSYIMKSRRTDAKSALMQAAQAMEKRYTENQSYAGATLGSGTTNVYPTTSPDGFYTLSFTAGPTAATYTLQAAPNGSQENDKCKNFTLTQAGVKGVNGGTLTSVSECW